MHQKTLSNKIGLKGYYDGIECSFDDYVFDQLDLKEELEQAVGHELIAPLIVEEYEDFQCPDECVVIKGLEHPDNECPHCSYLSLTMGHTPPYLRK